MGLLVKIADRDLKVPAFALDGIRCPLYVPLVVEGVEDAEDVDAILRRTVDEGIDHVVSIRAVADEGLPAKKHHEGRVGHEALEGP